MLPGLGNRCLIVGMKVRISKKCFLCAGHFCSCLDSGPGGLKTRAHWVLYWHQNSRSCSPLASVTSFCCSVSFHCFFLLHSSLLGSHPGQKGFSKTAGNVHHTHCFAWRLLCFSGPVVTAFNHDFIPVFKLEVETPGWEIQILFKPWETSREWGYDGTEKVLNPD